MGACPAAVQQSLAPQHLQRRQHALQSGDGREGPAGGRGCGRRQRARRVAPVLGSLGDRPIWPSCTPPTHTSATPAPPLGPPAARPPQTPPDPSRAAPAAGCAQSAGRPPPHPAQTRRHRRRCPPLPLLLLLPLLPLPLRHMPLCPLLARPASPRHPWGRPLPGRCRHRCCLGRRCRCRRQPWSQRRPGSAGSPCAPQAVQTQSASTTMCSGAATRRSRLVGSATARQAAASQRVLTQPRCSL